MSFEELMPSSIPTGEAQTASWADLEYPNTKFNSHNPSLLGSTSNDIPWDNSAMASTQSLDSVPHHVPPRVPTGMECRLRMLAVEHRMRAARLYERCFEVMARCPAPGGALPPMSPRPMTAHASAVATGQPQLLTTEYANSMQYRTQAGTANPYEVNGTGTPELGSFLAPPLNMYDAFEFLT